jgi:hypothetical protein
MGRGIRLQVKLSSRDRQQLEELLSGGLQPVRTILRALALGTSAQVPDFVVPRQTQLVFQFFRSELTRMGRFPTSLLFLQAVFRPAETLRPLGGQPVAVLVEIHQREGRAQPLMVLTYAPVAHLGKSEDALQDAERMLHFGPNSRLSRVLAPGIFIHTVLVSGPAACHVLRLRSRCADNIPLSLIACVSPHFLLLAVQ